MAHSFRDPDHLYPTNPKKLERIDRERWRQQLQDHLEEQERLYRRLFPPPRRDDNPFPDSPFRQQPGPQSSYPALPHDGDPGAGIAMTANAPTDLKNWLHVLMNDRQRQAQSERAGETGKQQSSDTSEASDASRLLGLVSGTPMQFWSVQPPLHFRF